MRLLARMRSRGKKSEVQAKCTTPAAETGAEGGLWLWAGLWLSPRRVIGIFLLGWWSLRMQKMISR